ncbi:MAG TPA: hypothetical protein VKB56_04930 [Terriglobales bacterium]|nr:hypothetical protein [Terriglobales bacterium]
MTYTRLTEGLGKLVALLGRNPRLVALALAAGFMTLAIQPAQAQSSDYWKSAAIIGGSTAAGAYIGHKVAGPTGTMIGAGMGAAVGYAIDSRRRAGAYNSYGDGSYGPSGQYGPYGGNAPYGGPYNGPSDPNAGPYGNGPYGGNVPYGNGPYGSAYPYPPDFQNTRNSRAPRSRSFR